MTELSIHIKRWNDVVEITPRKTDDEGNLDVPVALNRNDEVTAHVNGPDGLETIGPITKTESITATTMTELTT